jgi:hypothetical protein
MTRIFEDNEKCQWRFTSEGAGLVNGDVDGHGETAVGGVDDITNLEGDHVTRNKTGRLDFGPTLPLPRSTLAFGGQRIHESLHSVTRAALVLHRNR